MSLALQADTASRAGSTSSRRHLASWVVGLAVYLLLVGVGSQLLNDPDTQWHIAIGRWIAANGTVPSTDLFSYTFRGAPWIAKEWGSQLILATAFRLGGWSLVVATAAAAIAATFGVLHAFLAHRMRASAALALTLVAILLAAPHFLARPHALVLPITIVWTIGLVRALESGRAPSPLLAVLMVLWANMHGSFPLGGVLAVMLAGEGVVFRPQGERLAAARHWALFLGLAAGATLVTPYGLRAILVPLQMEGNGETFAYVAEWQPLHFGLESVLAFLLLGVGLLALGADVRKNAFRIATLLVLAAMMVRHGRFLGPFAILAPLLFAAALAARFKLAPETDGAAHRPLLRLLAIALAAAALAMTAFASPAPAPKMTPEAAFRAAQTLEGPVYNDYDFGGFLIAHGVPTFVDGRTDQLFLGRFLPRLDAALRAPGDADFAAILAEHGVAWALVRPGSDDARHLAHMEGWSKLYQDDVAAVFSRRQ